MDDRTARGFRHTPPRIRIAEPGDASEIARLNTDLGYSATISDIESRLSMLLSLDRCLVSVAAGPDNTLLGWVAVEHRSILESGDMAEIVGLIVDRGARRTGVGRALVAEAERWATEKGLAQIVVRSNVVREEAHDFYQDIGFTRHKTQHMYMKAL